MKAILFALAALTGSTFAEPLDIYADAVKGRETFVLHGKRYTGTASLVDQLHKPAASNAALTCRFSCLPENT